MMKKSKKFELSPHLKLMRKVNQFFVKNKMDIPIYFVRGDDDAFLYVNYLLKVLQDMPESLFHQLLKDCGYPNGVGGKNVQLEMIVERMFKERKHHFDKINSFTVMQFPDLIVDMTNDYPWNVEKRKNWDDNFKERVTKQINEMSLL
jgi:hypothetical protein